MYSYIAGVIGRTWWQLFQLFAVPFALAVGLQWVGSRIRRKGGGRFGDVYWYFVAPGVVCHETGHAVGCLLTGCKICEFVPFTRDGGTKLGYVVHEMKRGVFGDIASFVIACGPIWFGCLMIVLLSYMFGGVIRVADYRDYFTGDMMPGLIDYLGSVANATVGVFSALLIDGTWGWGFAIWLYLVFCIASEIGLSGVDLQHMWRGAVTIAILFLILNLIPPVGRSVSIGIFVILPWLFKFHVLMLSALALNTILMLVVGMLSNFRR